MIYTCFTDDDAESQSAVTMLTVKNGLFCLTSFLLPSFHIWLLAFSQASMNDQEVQFGPSSLG